VRLVALVCVAAAPLVAHAAGVQVTGTVQFRGEKPVLELTVRGAEHEATDDVTPTIVYQHRDWKGAPATIPAGGSHSWSFDLPAPDAPGTFPVSIRVDHRGAGGTAMTPLVLVLATPGAAASPVVPTVTTTPIGGFGRGELSLENRDDRAVAGRASFLLPSGFRTDPESSPQRLAPGERTVLPLLIENRGAPTTAADSLFAIFEYDADGTHYTVMATAPLVVTARGPSAVPIAIGLTALAMAVGVLAIAWRRAATR
jgi:hypothetical protein